MVWVVLYVMTRVQ